MQILVIAGEHNLLYDDGTEQFRNVTDLRQHEDYGGLGGSGNDVCVITLEEPLEWVLEVLQFYFLLDRNQDPEWGWLSHYTRLISVPLPSTE